MKEQEQSEFRLFCDHYANNCVVCKGQKSVVYEGVPTKCICQERATLEYRYSKIPVYPAALKYKDWSDFTGEIKDISTEGRNETVGLLSDCGVWAKKKAMAYCFKDTGPDATKNRRDNLIVLNHLRDGQNVVIVGGRSTGKTLIAALINREIALAGFYARRQVYFRWVKATKLMEAARWDNNKPVDHDTLEDLVDVDFLTIDGIDMPVRGSHTTPPDSIAMNALFGDRLQRKRPTITVMSDAFYHCATHPSLYIDVVKTWGEDFLSLITMPTNVVIELQRENNQ